MNENDEILKAVTDPALRTFFKSPGKIGLGAAAGGLVLFTAALVAEDPATVFYCHGLVGQVIQDPALASRGGLPSTPVPILTRHFTFPPGPSTRWPVSWQSFKLSNPPSSAPISPLFASSPAWPHRRLGYLMA